MKQIEVTDAILKHLRDAKWEGSDVSSIAVYEATALNTLPLRKDHPIFKGATATQNLLRKMEMQLNAESLPLQIMHDMEPLPIGRVFRGEVINGENGPELRTLFWVDKTHENVVKLIENSTVDQVSVHIQPKSATCATCGFDFLGEDADIEHWWSGKDPEGHVMGANGHHVVLSDLTKWPEMSVVGRGGAVGARIRSSQNSYFSGQRMAAAADAGPAVLLTALQLSSGELGERPATKESGMELKDVLAQLTEKMEALATEKAQSTLKDTQIAALTEQVAQLTTKVTGLETQLADVTKTAGDAPKLAAALTDVAKHFLTLSGKATEAPATDHAQLMEQVATQLKDIRLAVSGTDSRSTENQNTGERAVALSAKAFKSARATTN